MADRLARGLCHQSSRSGGDANTGRLEVRRQRRLGERENAVEQQIERLTGTILIAGLANEFNDTCRNN